MRNVKGEVFGSRNSVLAKVFQENQIEYISNIWFLTCRNAINPDISTRYLVLVEKNDTIDTSIFAHNIPVF